MKRSPLVIILVVALVDLIGFGLIIPLQAVYAERLGASGAVLGLLLGVYALMQFIFNPILGRWSDRVGRRPVLLISVGGSVLSHAMLGVADLAHSLPLLFVARILDGITGANVATAQAYIADVTEGQDRARGMGLFGATFGLGFVLGPALAAALAAVGTAVSGAHGTSWPAFGAAAMSLASLVGVAVWLPESVAAVAAPKASEAGEGAHRYGLRELFHIGTRPRIAELIVILSAGLFAFVMLEATFVLLCIRRFELKESGVGLIFAFVGMVMVVMQGGAIGPLVKRFGEPTMLAAGAFPTAAGFALLACLMRIRADAAAWAVLLAACLIIGVGRGMSNPTLMALISRQARRTQQGATLGLAQGLGYLARAVSPPIAGLLYDHRPDGPYWAGALLFAALGFYSWSVRRAQQAALSDASTTGEDT